MDRKNKNETLENNIAKSTNARAGKKRKNKTSKVVMSCFLFGVVIGIIIGVMVTVAILNKNNVTNKTNIVGVENKKDEVEDSIDKILEEEGFLIETPIINLYYPKKWKDLVHIEQIEGDVCAVQFIATLEGKDDIKLFDIIFGGEEGYVLGVINGEESEQIPVNIISHNLELDESWSPEEENTLYTMLEDVNYIIGMLEKEDNFIINK